MTFRRLGVLYAFFTYAIFNLSWIYKDAIPPDTEEDMYRIQSNTGA